MTTASSYLSYARDIGIEMLDDITLMDLPDGERGLVVLQDTEPRTVLISVPMSSIMTTESCHNDPQLARLLSLSLREDDLLAILLLHEKHVKQHESKFFQHIKLLPVKYHSIPNYTDDEFKFIRGSNLYTTGKSWQKQIQSDYDDLLKTNLEDAETIESCFPFLSFDEYLWALSTIWSRFMTIDGKRSMVPLVDFLNHSPTSTVGHRVTAEGIFQVYSNSPWYFHIENLDTRNKSFYS
jgi:hypothetical protein